MYMVILKPYCFTHLNMRCFNIKCNFLVVLKTNSFAIFDDLSFSVSEEGVCIETKVLLPFLSFEKYNQFILSSETSESDECPI